MEEKLRQSSECLLNQDLFSYHQIQAKNPNLSGTYNSNYASNQPGICELENSKKTNLLINEYQTLLSDMKNQIMYMRRLQSNESNENETNQYEPDVVGSDNIQSIEQFERKIQKMNILPQMLFSESSSKQFSNDVEERHQIQVQGKQQNLKDEELYEIISGNKKQVSNQDVHKKDLQQQYISSYINSEYVVSPQVKQRRCTEYNSINKHENLNQRLILSSMNLKQQQAQEPIISTSSQFKFTNSSLASPTSQKVYFSNRRTQNKENINTNSPLSNASGQDIEKLYCEQVKINQQLIEQIKQIKLKTENKIIQSQQDNDIKIMKLMESEDFLKDKCQNLEKENIELKEQINDLSQQIEGSLRNNQELETYLENCEVSQQQFTDKQKGFNKKIQDLNKKICSLKEVNLDLEQRIKILEIEKAKISEKWIRLSARQKVEEKNKHKSLVKEKEVEQFQKEIELLNQKIQIIERENQYMKEKTDSYKEKLNKQLSQISEYQSKTQILEQEKLLADKVTGELLTRIQKYEQEIQQLASINSTLQDQARQYSELQGLQDQYSAMQNKLDILQQESVVLTEYNKELEQDNQRLLMELQQQKQANQFKQQHIESLQLQLEHQNDQCKEMQIQLKNFLTQQSKQNLIFSVKFTPIELQKSIDYIMNQITFENEQNNKNTQMLDKIDEDQVISGIIIKAAEKLKVMNNYFLYQKKELQEVNDKYDKILIKQQQLLQEKEQMKNKNDAISNQKESLQIEISELKEYIHDLENIIKNSGGTTFSQDELQLFKNNVQDKNSNQIDNKQISQGRNKYCSLLELSPAIMRGSYQTIPTESISEDKSTIFNSLQNQQSITQTKSSLYHNTSTDSQNQSLRYLEKIATQRRSLVEQNLQSIMTDNHSYNHKRVCLPTMLISSCEDNLTQNNHQKEYNYQSVQEPLKELPLQEQIVSQLQKHKKYQQQLITKKNQQSIINLQPKQNFWSQRPNNSQKPQSFRQSHQSSSQMSLYPISSKKGLTRKGSWSKERLNQ